MTFWTVLEDYQTLIVGALGFAGVISTLRYNARLAREQRRDERSHERQALRAALIEELQINREAAVENAASLKEEPETGPRDAFVPTDPMDDAYRAFIGRIGLLSRAEVGKVMRAYLLLRTCGTRLLLIGVPPATGENYVRVPSENVGRLAQLLEVPVRSIDEAIEVMEAARDAETTATTATPKKGGKPGA
jgi:hypothetical protein